MKMLRSISAILFATLVLISSTSFVVGLHICMGEIQHVALFTKADGCEKEQKQPPCHRQKNTPCCADETIIHDGVDFKASIDHVNIVLPPPIEIEQPLLLISEVIPASPLSSHQFCSYDPPIRSCDLTIEQQIFRI